MSDSYDASIPFVLPSVTVPTELYLHVPPTRDHEHLEQEVRAPEVVHETRCAPYFKIKSAMDRLITAILMIVALPVMMLVSLAILVLDGRPVFYRQTRVGKNGQLFRIWKFRTMRHNAESTTGAVWSTATDPRVTTLGRWLRCAHLDELPQFFNVLVGDMDLIGPRPERPEFVRELALELPSYLDRLKVRPGITGFAQLRLGYDRSVADVSKKVALDLEYIRTASFLQDAKILLGTLPYIARQVTGKWKVEHAMSRSGWKQVGNSPSSDETSDVVLLRLSRPPLANSVELDAQQSRVPNAAFSSGPNAKGRLAR